jgi:hypothetical protein
MLKVPFSKLETDFIGVFCGKFVPVILKSPSNKIDKIPSRKSPIRDFRHQLHGKAYVTGQALHVNGGLYYG